MNLSVGTNYCKCCACGEYFNSEHAFDVHRTGNHGNRRCFTTSEMIERGMGKSGRDYWVSAMRKFTDEKA